MSSILKTPTLLAPPARESKRGQQSLETQRARALRVFYAALADRRSNPCNIVVMGDSITQGQGATVWGARWVDRFRDQMRQKFPVTGVTGGVGYISTTNGLTGGSSSIFPVAHSGTVTTNSQSGPKKRSRVFSASGHITTWTVVGTAVDLVYWQGTSTGTVKWSVDGGSTTNQSTVGGSSASGTTFRISLGTAGVHTVTVEWVSGTSYIEGLIVYNGDETTGVRVHEAGRSGISAYQWDQVNHENASTAWARAVGQLNPHLLIIALGINDWAQSTANGGAAGTAADYKTYLKSLIADIRSNTTIDPSIMLLSYATPNASPYDTAYSFAQYADVCEQIAAEDAEVCTLDLGLRLPKVSGDVLSLYSDTTHPNNKGHAMIADLVMQVLGAGGGAGGSSATGTVTSVSGTAPIQVATGTTTPAITIDAATTSAPGSVELATTAETRTGTDTDRAITPVAAAQTYPTGLIARNSYNPSSLSTYSTTTSLADVDATNMAVTFTAPPSGTVEVELDAMTSGGSVRHTWGLREGTSDLVWQGISNDASTGRKVAKFVVSGMTPGSTHTFKWSQLGASTAAATYAGLTSSHYWPAHMRVYGVPVPTSDFDRVLTPLAGSISSQAWSLHVPIGPGPRGLVIWCHGRGGAATDYTGAIRAATATALLDAGYMVGGTAAHGDNFGNDNSLADIKAFYDMVNAAYPVSDVIMWGESMGALDALLISAGVKSVPNVRGAMIFSGVCSLANAYAGIGDAAFTGQINTAYGITGTPPNTYALLTAGYDPVLRSTSDYSGKRFRFTGSSSDTTATKASHMDVMTAAISGVTAECVSVTSTGGHSDASQYADTSAILAYVARCVAD